MTQLREFEAEGRPVRRSTKPDTFPAKRKEAGEVRTMKSKKEARGREGRDSTGIDCDSIHDRVGAS